MKFEVKEKTKVERKPFTSSIDKDILKQLKRYCKKKKVKLYEAIEAMIRYCLDEVE